MRNLILILATALTFSGFAYANDLTCESSHLSTLAPNLEKIAANLARLRLHIYLLPNGSGEKSRADQEFKTKYAEFALLSGDEDRARALFQSQMRLAQQSNSRNESEESKRRELEQTKREREIFNPTNLGRKMEFHEILPGKFMMGEEPKVAVEITQPFAMMATPVTQMTWTRLKIAMGEKNPSLLNPSYYKDGPGSMTLEMWDLKVQMKPEHPVERVSWIATIKFIEGLNQLSISDDPMIQEILQSLIPDHQKGDHYDLPTDAQWEFVMRNRGQARGIWFDRNDDSELAEYAHYDKSSNAGTQAVARLKPRLVDGNAFYDLEGNVLEWTRTIYERRLQGGKDPQGPLSGAAYVIRGGSLADTADHLRSSYRYDWAPTNTYTYLGFRLVRTRP